MKQNPYDTPKSKAVPGNQSGKPLTAYWIASLIVVIAVATCILILVMNSIVTISDGNVTMHIPGETVMSTPYDRRMVAYDRMIYTSVGSAVVLLAILLSIVLAIVNGLTFVLRQRLGY